MVWPIDLRERDQVGEAWTLGTRPADPRTAAMPLHVKRDTTKTQCAKARGGLRQSSCERVVVLNALGNHCRRPLHLRRDDILRQQIARMWSGCAAETSDELALFRQSCVPCSALMLLQNEPRHRWN